MKEWKIGRQGGGRGRGIDKGRQGGRERGVDNR